MSLHRRKDLPAGSSITSSAGPRAIRGDVRSLFKIGLTEHGPRVIERSAAQRQLGPSITAFSARNMELSHPLTR